ncbi:hypothetical protein [Methanobrevibacter sp.]|uniref:hypothetical protein n=1 Tax=Methanobrevibacter sp. TaxID=66852 RepID=UPI00388E5A99
MLIKEENFRNLYKTPIIIKNKEFSHQIAQSLQIDSIWEDDISSDELKEKLESIKIDDNINAILAFPYIDHTSGMSILILSTASINDKDVTINKREDFSVWSIARKDNINNSEFEYLENLNVNDDFNLGYYNEFISKLDNYHVNNDIEALRFIEVLDESRNEDFPDDVMVFFIKENCQMERMWVRYENIVEKSFIEGTLLNTPYQDFGVESGDKVIIFPYKPKEDEDTWVLICDLNQ